MAILLDDPDAGSTMAALIGQRLAAASLGQPLTYRATVYELTSTPPPGG